MPNISNPTSWRPPLWTLSLYLILPFLAFPEIIFGGQTLYRTDISWIHYPGHIFMANEWLAGRVPLWDPYRQAGMPMLAEPQIGVLYPLRALFLSPLSPSLELSLFILLHFPLAALFTYILARSLRLSQGAATLSGLVFGFGGFLMAQVSNVNIMTGAVWLPLALYAVIQATRQRSWLAALLAGLPLALQTLTAHSQIIFYTLVTVAGYGLYRLAVDFLAGPPPRRRNLRYALQTGLLVVAAIVTGMLLAAPQLLPSSELLQFTLRSQARGLELLTENSLHPLMWLNLLLPSAFGNNVIGFKGGDPFQEVFTYVGFMPLLLAAIGLRAWRRPDQPFFILLLVSAGVLALGDHTPLYRYVIQYLPGFDLFRIPARWLMVVTLALAVLAGFGLDLLLEKGLSRRALAILLGGGLLLGLGLILIGGFSGDLLNWSSQLDGSYGQLTSAFLSKALTPNPIYQERLLLRWAFGLNTPAFLLLANLVAASVLLWLWTTRRISEPTFTDLILLAASLDLLLAGGTAINPVRPEERWQALSGGARYVLEHVGAARVFPLGVSGEDEATRNLGQYFPSAYRVHSASGYSSPLKLARYENFLDEADPVQAIQVLAVRYLLTEGQMGADVAATYPLVYNDAHSYVYENKEPLPRAFVVHAAVLAASPAEALAYFQRRTLDPRQTVVLESKPEETPPTLPPLTTLAASAAEIVAENPQQLEIEASLSADGYLVLLDTFFPGWEATVDGQPTPIYRADYLGRAVFVPAGEHTIHFEYRPWSFQVGMGLALIMLIAMVGVSYKDKIRRPQS
ncbi:MAG: hypothetical protein HS126_21170 [Anaerolineales bacterium]|nr:hypothetical protein [Anaerolineales bacterium]